jgi:hypothetical protein
MALGEGVEESGVGFLQPPAGMRMEQFLLDVGIGGSATPAAEEEDTDILPTSVSQLQPIDRAGWLFTPEELQLDGLEMEEGITVARGLVDVATAGRFRLQEMPVPPEPPVHAARVPPLTLRCHAGWRRRASRPPPRRWRGCWRAGRSGRPWRPRRAARQILWQLTDPHSVQAAFVLREVLDQPVTLREWGAS